MTDRSSNTADNGSGRHPVLAWLLFPLALFPLAALLTYDWRSISALCIPPRPHTNWIGALGDGFAYYGYSLFGLAVWTIPVLCIVAGLCAALGRRARILRRLPWLALFLVATSGLLQVIGGHGGPVASFAASVNTSNPGGAVGYLVMTRALSPLISDFGSSVVMSIAMAFSLIAAVGLRDMAAILRALANWASARGASGGSPAGAPASGGADEADSVEQERYLAALRAKEDARRQKEEEKARIKAEKIAAKEAKRAAKEAAKAEKLAAKQSAAEPAAGAAAKPQAQQEAAPAAEPEDKGPYVLPSTNLLKPLSKSKADHGDVGEMSKRLIDTLKIFNIDAELAYTVPGPVVTKYALHLAPGIRYSAVKSISDNLMGALHAKSIRIEAPIPGEDSVGIEVPNRTPAGITFREIVEEAREYIRDIGGFEKFAEWGFVR